MSRRCPGSTGGVNGAIHKPDETRAGAILPKNVGLVIAVEIARAGDLPGGRHRWQEDAAAKVVSFMSQRARVPEVFCQRTSALPSPLKSLFMARGAEDTVLKTLTLQPAGRAGPNRPELRTLLLRYHIAVCRVLPLKSR